MKNYRYTARLGSNLIEVVCTKRKYFFSCYAKQPELSLHDEKYIARRARESNTVRELIEAAKGIARYQGSKAV